ncbi:hypothetical protein DOTSEDRAFT_175305 [Dothistroma septosporum NZE10]|uniref:Metallo-beta-lactamase domain-containing protein n=1 Tax=Dothistroma septosporum (strain NZE10 / CBS 128990) TaxID=675120 RepID=N1PL89_DOTSN|nr:hypothetical protein DOTSEDRAFT_175305 [Dothistroma septosporum NZE10]
MSDTQPQAKPAPTLNLPKSDNICEVSIIDTTCNLVVPPSTLVEPEITGHEWLNLPTYSFYIKNQRTGEQVLFDLGSRRDWQNLVPSVYETVSVRVPGLKVEKEVIDIVKDGGVDPDGIKALILSHWHYDHSGNISRLNKKTDVIVGPGFLEAFQPGYPANATSPFHEADFEGRNFIEPPFSDRFKIGCYQAHDYFGDGSLYVLNVPGHTTGHISALVRTTPETFIFLGGDVCHFTGVIRPSPYIPLPDYIPQNTVLDPRLSAPCPCSIFTKCHPDQQNSRTSAFYRCSTGGPYGSWYDDPQTAMVSITSLFDFDADANVMVMIAHDSAPKDFLKFFPNGTINDWKSMGSKGAMHWHFVNELPTDGKQERAPLVDGLYRDDGQGPRRVKTLYGEQV